MNARGHKLLVVLACLERHLAEVKDKVANLAKELILVLEPIGSVAPGNVRISVNHSDALEGAAAFDSWWAGSIADELSVVQLNNRSTDFVSPGL